jgi:putative oxidoreductase
VQRLFSTFPNSWPGIGLLILRAGAGFSALAVADLDFSLSQIAAALALSLIVGIAVLIWIGLWTPVAAVAAALLQIGSVVSGHELIADSAVNAALGLGLAMLGPGAWSLDARLFGRKRLL